MKAKISPEVKWQGETYAELIIAPGIFMENELEEMTQTALFVC